MAKKKKTKKNQNKFRIETLEEATELLYKRYKRSLKDMDIFFCFPTLNNKNPYFIFQSISGCPIKDIVPNKINNSIYFLLEWKTIKDKQEGTVQRNIKNNDGFIKWEEVQDVQDVNWGVHAERNTQLERWGSYKTGWAIDYSHIKTRQNKVHSTNEFRLENVKRIDMYEWGFEIYSSMFNIIIINSCFEFPYQKFGSSNSEVINYLERDVGAQDIITLDFHKKNFVFHYAKKGEIHCYWVDNSEAKEYLVYNEDYDFEEDIDRLLMGNTQEEVLNVGQSSSDNLII